MDTRHAGLGVRIRPSGHRSFVCWRKGEVRTFRWRDVDGDTLNLADAKNGPRRVFLNAPVHAILKWQPRSESTYVFPSPTGIQGGHSIATCRSGTRYKEAEIEDVRIHDLRHTFESHAVLQGIPLPVVSCPLGHTQPSMTLRYAHVADREIEAAERIGSAIAGALADGQSCSSS